MQRRAKRRTSARMDQWTRSLSKVAPQSRICVKTWTLPYSGQAFDRLYRPTAGQDMRHQRGHFQWQTTDIYEDGVVAYILDQTRGHPFLVQAVCYALIENLNAKKKERASIKDIDGAIERVFENFNNYFSDLWNRTDEHQRACLIALQKAGTTSIEYLQEQSGLKEHTLWHTLHALLKRDLVQQENDQYSISTPIFSAWVERNSKYMEQ